MANKWLTFANIMIMSKRGFKWNGNLSLALLINSYINITIFHLFSDRLIKRRSSISSFVIKLYESNAIKIYRYTSLW